MKKIKYQLLKFIVPSAKAVVNINANTDKLYQRITGMFISLPDDNAFAGSALQLHIDDYEVFPEDYEAKMLTCGNQVAPNDRFYSLDEQAGGSTVRGKFTDGALSAGIIYPYTGIIYLRLEDRGE